MFLLQVVNAECMNRSCVTAIELQSSVPSYFAVHFHQHGLKISCIVLKLIADPNLYNLSWFFCDSQKRA